MRWRPPCSPYQGDPLWPLSIDKVLEKVVFAEFTAELFISDQYVGVFRVTAWDAREHDFGGFHSALHDSVWETKGLADMSCFGFNELVVTIWGKVEEENTAVFCPA